MGGQQFGTDTVHLDMRGMTRILGLDDATGIVHVEAGIEWSEFIDGLLAMQAGPAGCLGDPPEADRLGPPDASAARSPRTSTAAG